MILTYKNEYGTIRMAGGGKDNAWCVTEITGIGFPKRNFTYNTYAGVYGQELASVSIPSRTITISGDISVKAQKALPMHLAAKILNADGELSLQTGRKARRLNVRTLSFEVQERKMAYKTFVLQLESDNPYFWGPAPLSYSVFSRQNLLKSTFTLPCVFSRRNMSATVINNGDAECEPVLTIFKPEQSEVLESDTLIIKNEANGAVITLNHIMQPGETVTVDIPNRTIVSDSSGSILQEISDDTVLRSFVLLTGKNQVSCVSGDASLAVVCKFETLHLEASHYE